MTITTSDRTHKGARHPWWEATKTAIAGLAIAAGFHTFIAEVRHIPSESMTPTLQVGDQLIIEKLSYRMHPPQRGDIVVFKAPPQLKAIYFKDDLIKRVIGLPGEEVAIVNSKVFINGHPLNEPYVQVPASYHFKSVMVPGGHYFVLGDNRNHSFDSHLWGFLPERDIIGHAAIRFFPIDRFKSFLDRP